MSQPRITQTSIKHHKIFSSSIISIFDAFNIQPRNQGAVLKLDQFHITKGNPQQLSINIHRGEIIHNLEAKKNIGGIVEVATCRLHLLQGPLAHKHADLSLSHIAPRVNSNSETIFVLQQVLEKCCFPTGWSGF